MIILFFILLFVAGSRSRHLRIGWILWRKRSTGTGGRLNSSLSYFIKDTLEFVEKIIFLYNLLYKKHNKLENTNHFFHQNLSLIIDFFAKYVFQIQQFWRLTFFLLLISLLIIFCRHGLIIITTYFKRNFACYRFNL